MRTFAAFLGLILAITCFPGLSCQDPAPSSAAKTTAADTANVPDLLPANADSAAVAFTDSNFYVSNDAFCIASVVDNKTDLWQKIWIRIEVLDANGNVLTVSGDSSVVLRALSDAVPPRGATAFFCGLPLRQISGVPAACRLSGAGAVTVPPGPILIASSAGGIRVMYHDPKDFSKKTESEFRVNGTLENPLDKMAAQFRVVVLIYGMDKKLYFVQAIDPHAPGAVLQMERAGPLAPQEKRKISCPIHYQQLPQKLQDLLIQRVDLQAYEAR